MDRTLAIVPARYQASRFPGKLLRKIGDKTVLEWVYYGAQQSKKLEAILVTTDDQRIYQKMQSVNIPVVMTATEFSSGSERIASLHHEYAKYDIIVNIQGDEPGISGVVIDAVIQKKQEHRNWAVTTAAYQSQDPKEISNPQRVKVVFDRSFRALYFSRAPIPYYHNSLQQSAYIHTGIYAYEKEFLLQLSQLPYSELEKIEALEQLKILDSGQQIGVAIIKHAILSVDVPQDLVILREIYSKHKSLHKQS